DKLREFMNSGKEFPKKTKINIDFEVNPEIRKIELTIPIEIFNARNKT
ncbi:MAG: hypothetical protein RIT41_1716, partial [Bacteroidota bacterium]